MFASTLFADENDVGDFNEQIQNLLRIGRADEAAAILEAALGQIGDASHPVVARCQACPVEAVEIVGWERLAARIEDLDATGATITALGVDITWPGHSGLAPDADGMLEPHLETSYYTDSAFPFSARDRTALLEGYESAGALWQGRMAETDTLLSVRGLGRLYGVVYPLVEDITATPEPDPLNADAMRMGAAFVAVRLHQAVARAIHRHGLPRALAVIVGSDESYPFYEAPVISTAESREFASCSCDAVPADAPAPKDPILEELAVQADDVPDVALPGDSGSPAAEADDRVVQISGAALRQRLGQQNDGAEPAPRPVAASGLLRRLFARQAASG